MAWVTLDEGDNDAVVRYQQEHNLQSIDGLPALPALDRSSV